MTVNSDTATVRRTVLMGSMDIDMDIDDIIPVFKWFTLDEVTPKVQYQLRGSFVQRLRIQEPGYFIREVTYLIKAPNLGSVLEANSADVDNDSRDKYSLDSDMPSSRGTDMLLWFRLRGSVRNCSSSSSSDIGDEISVVTTLSSNTTTVSLEELGGGLMGSLFGTGRRAGSSVTKGVGVLRKTPFELSKEGRLNRWVGEMPTTDVLKCRFFLTRDVLRGSMFKLRCLRWRRTDGSGMGDSLKTSSACFWLTINTPAEQKSIFIELSGSRGVAADGNLQERRIQSFSRKGLIKQGNYGSVHEESIVLLAQQQTWCMLH